MFVSISIHFCECLWICCLSVFINACVCLFVGVCPHKNMLVMHVLILAIAKLQNIPIVCFLFRACLSQQSTFCCFSHIHLHMQTCHNHGEMRQNLFKERCEGGGESLEEAHGHHRECWCVWMPGRKMFFFVNDVLSVWCCCCFWLLAYLTFKVDRYSHSSKQDRKWCHQWYDSFFLEEKVCAF